MDEALPFIKSITKDYENIIIAGDTNCARSTSERLNSRKYKDAHLQFLNKYLFLEAIWKFNDRQEIPTWRGRGKDWYMCNDHIFVKGKIENNIFECNVIKDPDPPSDHAPVMAKFK